MQALPGPIGRGGAFLPAFLHLHDRRLRLARPQRDVERHERPAKPSAMDLVPVIL